MSNNNKRKFGDTYGELPGKNQVNIRDEIMRACGWKSRNLFYMKKNGTRSLTETEELIVEGIFRRHGFDAWTGEKLKQTA